MKKERIEDLGRLSVMIGEILKNDLFEHFDRPKWAVDKFVSLNEEQQHELIHTIAYGIEEVQHRLSDCLCIADGDEDDER
jgi:hypothetical protein